MPGERLLGRWPRKCKVCGREFFANDDWVYKEVSGKKRTITWFCGWGCIQEYRREHEKKKL